MDELFGLTLFGLISVGTRISLIDLPSSLLHWAFLLLMLAEWHSSNQPNRPPGRLMETNSERFRH